MVTTLALRTVLVAAPVFLMIGLIPFVRNDYVLTLIYIAIIAVAALRYTRNDFIFLVFGFFMLMLGEYAFVSTGVEVFERQTLFGVMPIWLPFLWAYIFVTIRHSALLFEKYLPR
jgi:hypothetical protein